MRRHTSDMVFICLPLPQWDFHGIAWGGTEKENRMRYYFDPCQRIRGLGHPARLPRGGVGPEGCARGVDSRGVPNPVPEGGSL